MDWLAQIPPDRWVVWVVAIVWGAIKLGEWARLRNDGQADVTRQLAQINKRMDRASAQYSDLSGNVQGLIGRVIRLETRLDLPSRERPE
jgi:hypothetical protein